MSEPAWPSSPLTCEYSAPGYTTDSIDHLGGIATKRHIVAGETVGLFCDTHSAEVLTTEDVEDI